MRRRLSSIVTTVPAIHPVDSITDDTPQVPEVRRNLSQRRILSSFVTTTAPDIYPIDSINDDDDTPKVEKKWLSSIITTASAIYPIDISGDDRPQALVPVEVQNHVEKFVLYIFSFITSSLSAGLVYGYPHLRKYLLYNGSNLPESQLGIMYTIGCWTALGGRFFLGLARDRYGTRNVAFFCILCAVCGCLGLGFSDENDIIALTVSYFFVGLGSGSQLCLQPVASLFPKAWQGTILASLSGAFQISGLIFLVLKRISHNRKVSFGYLSTLLIVISLFSLRLLPKNQFMPNDKNHEPVRQLEKEDVMEVEIDNTRGDTLGKTTTITQSDKKHANEKTPLELMKSKEYLLLLLWFTVLVIPSQYYIGTISYQLELKGDDGHYLTLFSIFYASSALLSPAIGKIADVAGLGVTQMIATVLITISLSILNSALLQFQVAGMLCMSIGRLALHSMYFTNIGKRFGYTHYGTLTGLGLFISAIFSLLQYPLINAAAKGHGIIVNTTSGFISLGTGIPYCIWLIIIERREKLERKEQQEVPKIISEL